MSAPQDWPAGAAPVPPPAGPQASEAGRRRRRAHPGDAAAADTRHQEPQHAAASSRFQQRQQRFLAAAAKSSTPGHLRRQTPGGRRGPHESAWRMPLLPSLLARVHNSPHICRPAACESATAKTDAEPRPQCGAARPPPATGELREPAAPDEARRAPASDEQVRAARQPWQARQQQQAANQDHGRAACWPQSAASAQRAEPEIRSHCSAQHPSAQLAPTTPGAHSASRAAPTSAAAQPTRSEAPDSPPHIRSPDASTHSAQPDAPAAGQPQHPDLGHQHQAPDPHQQQQHHYLINHGPAHTQAQPDSAACYCAKKFKPTTTPTLSSVQDASPTAQGVCIHQAPASAAGERGPPNIEANCFNQHPFNTIVTNQQQHQKAIAGEGGAKGTNQQLNHRSSIIQLRQQQIFKAIHSGTNNGPNSQTCNNTNNQKSNQQPSNSYYPIPHSQLLNNNNQITIATSTNINNNNNFSNNNIATFQQASSPQPLHRNIMAHYKFHNDCQSSVLTYEQVKRLDLVMDQIVPIHGRGNSPTLYVKLKELIRLVKHKLQQEHSIEIRDVILNGGAASYVLAPENSHYNDLDLIFGTDLSDESRFDVIRDVVLECLMEFMPGRKQQQVCEHAVATATDELAAAHEQSIPIGSAPIDDDLNEMFGHNCLSSSKIKPGEVSTNGWQGSDSAEDKFGSVCDCHVSGVNGDRDGTTPHDNKNVSDRDVGIEKDAIKNVVREAQCESDNVSASAESESAIKMQQLSSVRPLKLTSGYNNSTSNQLQMPLNNCAIKEAYVHKMVKVNDDDRWSLISLGVQQSEANGCLNQQHRHQVLNGNQVYVQHLSDQREGSQLDHGAWNSGTKSEKQQECGMVSVTACVECGQMIRKHQLKPQEQPHYNHKFQQKQFPNSIELKFVDKMRRKFEFSVDSFQIILDSLIQFYDYAPRSTITIQRGAMKTSHPNSMVIGSGVSKPATTNHRTQPRECFNDKLQHRASIDSQTSDDEKSGKFEGLEQQIGSDHQKQPASYYQLPLQPSGSPFNSIASSSGCSSSSSVVSSSSSSLFCDEDQEDLYCDADGPPSSSASTSSLLSSTTISMLSTSSAGDVSEHAADVKSHKYQSTKAKSKLSKNLKLKESQRASTSASNITSNIQLESCLQCLDHPSLVESQGSQNEESKANSLQTQIQRNNTDKKSCSRDSEGSSIKSIITTSCAVISENFYPTVIGRSEYGNFKEALYHLEKKLIATRSPEEIRGGGLLKYCNLLVKNYTPTNDYQIRTLERYMCSRFFIDFSDLNQQRAKLESYLTNHFSDDPIQKFDYLTILHNVVQRSTVCLMNHELRLTLNMIRELAFKLNELHQTQHESQGLNQRRQSVSNVQHQYSAQQPSAAQITAEQRYYQQQNPVVVQSGVYRVKLVNYALSKPVQS